MSKCFRVSYDMIGMLKLARRNEIVLTLGYVMKIVKLFSV